MEAARATTKELKAITDRIRGLGPFGETKVLDVEATLSLDEAGEPVLRLIVTLSDPEEDAETWPTDDVVALKRRVRGIAWEENPELPFALVQLRSEHPDYGDETPE